VQTIRLTVRRLLTKRFRHDDSLRAGQGRSPTGFSWTPPVLSTWDRHLGRDGR
jgi:hypothetical protein